MSDWGQTFGSGISAESLIGSLNVSYKAEQDQLERDAKAKWWDSSTAFGRIASSILITFLDHPAMVAWEAENPNLTYVGRPWGQGFIMKVTSVPEGWQAQEYYNGFPNIYWATLRLSDGNLENIEPEC